MLNDELKPNFAELLRTSANLSAPTAGWGAEFCSCVESVLAIGHLQLQKGVVLLFQNCESATRYPATATTSPTHSKEAIAGEAGRKAGPQIQMFGGKHINLSPQANIHIAAAVYLLLSNEVFKCGEKFWNGVRTR